MVQEKKKTLLDLIRSSARGSILRNYLASGPATTEILRFIPEKKIRMILKLGRTLIEIRQTTERYKFMSKAGTLPIRDFKKIKHMLLSLQKDTWINQGDVDDIMRYIYRKCERTEKGARVLRSYTKDKEIERLKITKPLDVPLLIVAASLSAHLKKVTLPRRKWRLICDFMAEQKLINSDEDMQITETELRDRVRKTTEKRLSELYASYIEIYSAPAQPEESKLWCHMIEQTFPAWQEIIPR